MMDMDWSKAPEGTTHWDPVDKNHLRQYGKVSQYWNIERGWSEKGWQYPDDLSTMPRLIARPVWDGESTPPVGTVCEMTFDDGKFSWGYWLKTKVLCYGNTMVFVSQETDRKSGEWLEGSIKAAGMKFRPIRTPEQIAAEERNSAQKDIKQIILSSFKIDAITAAGIAGVLANSDYRKKVTK